MFCDEFGPTKTMVKNSLYFPAATFTIYGDGLKDVITGKVAAKDAVENCGNEELLEVCSEEEEPISSETLDELLDRLYANLEKH